MYLSRPITAPPGRLPKYNDFALLPRPRSPSCPVQEVDNVPGLVNDEDVSDVRREIQSARKERSGDHDMGLFLGITRSGNLWSPAGCDGFHRSLTGGNRSSRLILRSSSLIRLIRRLSRFFPPGELLQEPIQMFVRPSLPDITLAGESNIFDTLLLQIRAEHLDLRALIAEYEHFGQVVRSITADDASVDVVLRPDFANTLLDIGQLVPTGPVDVLRGERRGEMVEIGGDEAGDLRMVLPEVEVKGDWDCCGCQDEVERIGDTRRGGGGFRKRGLGCDGSIRDRVSPCGADVGKNQSCRLLEVRICNVH